MKQETAIKSIMRKIKYDENIPEEFQGFVREYLLLSYVMGYDQRGNDFVGHNMKPVIVLNKEGKQIADYPTITQAKKQRHYRLQIIQKSLHTGEPTHRGEIFKYKLIP